MPPGIRGKGYKDGIALKSRLDHYIRLGDEIERKLRTAIRKAGIGKPHANNNRIERLNGTLRERVKVQRGWKSFKTQIPEGMRIHYNFVKPHSALEGQTPAERAGILKFSKSQNKWLDLLLATTEKKSTTQNVTGALQ